MNNINSINKNSEIFIVSAILIIHSLLVIFGSIQMGLAYDELFHIPEGAALATLGFRKLVTAHTALGHWMTGLSMSFIDPVVDTQYYQSANTNVFEFTNRFLFSGSNNFRFTLLVARIPFYVCTILCPLYIYFLSRSLWGQSAGIISLILTSFCSSIIGWGRYVYMDVPQTLFMFATVAHVIWFLKKNSQKHLILSAIFFGLNCGIKYSGLFILPFIFTVIVISHKFYDLKTNFFRIDSIKNLITYSAVSAFSIWFSFGFPLNINFYFEGFSKLYTDMDPNFPFYFLGHFKPGGWWYYFPVNLFLKMSAASILLLILGILYSFNKNELKFDNKLIEKDCCIILLLLAPATLFLTATSIKALPLGSRYIIPCLPFIYCVCGYSFSYALNKKNFLLISLLSILISLHVYRTISIFPDEMAYFNEFIGDAGDGFLYVNDSSVDAGQNLPRLASFLRERGNPPVKILYQGQDRPEMYGIKTNVVTQSDWDIAPSPGIYAISANWLIYGQKETLDRPNVHKNWLTTYKPIKKLGGSIWIYEFQ